MVHSEPLRPDPVVRNHRHLSQQPNPFGPCCTEQSRPTPEKKMEASIRAIHIATVLRLLNQQRPLDATTAPNALKAAIKQAAVENNTESRRVHRNFVWALDYRGRGAQNRAALDLIAPDAPDFKVKVSTHLSAFDAAYVLKELGAQKAPRTITVPTPVVNPTPVANEPTATAIWLNEQIAKGLLDRITNAVKSRYPIEELEDVQGEVHLRVAHWCAKGSFDDHLAEGHPPSVSRMAAWVGNRVKSRLGRRGQDALWRQMRGSRTESEFRKEEVHPESLIPDQVFRVGLEYSEEGAVVREVVIDPASLETQEDAPEPAVSPEQALRMIIRASRPNAAQRYLKVLEGMVSEASRSDIANADGCSTSRAGKLTARVREDLKSVPMLFAISDARKVLRYIVEEPCITYSEIIEDLRMEGEEVDRALRLLTDPEIAYITESNGRSFLATEIGMAAATTERPGGAIGRLMI